jgi:hypothetical protein
MYISSIIYPSELEHTGLIIISIIRVVSRIAKDLPIKSAIHKRQIARTTRYLFVKNRKEPARTPPIPVEIGYATSGST